MTQVTEPCGCIITKHGGHTHTKLCEQCCAKEFGTKPPEPEPPADNSDLW